MNIMLSIIYQACNKYTLILIDYNYYIAMYSYVKCKPVKC